MDQKSLDIEIYEGNKALASALYFGDAMNGGTQKKLDAIMRETKNGDYREVKDPIARAIWLLEMTGAGIFWDEERYAKLRGYDVAENINEGEIYLSSKGRLHCSTYAGKTVRLILDDTGNIVDIINIGKQ